MLKEKHINTKKQGDEGLGSAIAYFTSLGYCVSIPLTDSQEYDLIIDWDGYLWKVQVKTTTYKTKYDSYNANLSVKGGNRSGIGRIKKFDPNDVDYVFILTPKDRYLIPSWILGSSSVTLGKKYEDFKV